MFDGIRVRSDWNVGRFLLNLVPVTHVHTYHASVNGFLVHIWPGKERRGSFEGSRYDFGGDEEAAHDLRKCESALVQGRREKKRLTT